MRMKEMQIPGTRIFSWLFMFMFLARWKLLHGKIQFVKHALLLKLERVERGFSFNCLTQSDAPHICICESQEK